MQYDLVPGKIISLSTMFHGKDAISADILLELMDEFSKLEPGQHITINLAGEGYCFETSGLNSIIKLAANRCEILYSNITLETAGVIKSKTPFNQIHDNTIESFGGELGTSPSINKKITHKFCIFVNRATFYRLVLSSWFYENAREVTFQSFNADVSELLGDINDLVSVKDDIPQILKFMDALPIYLDFPNLDNFVKNNLNRNWELLTKYYTNSFLEFVIETEWSGTVFYPTEKIFRPMALKTPFIVFGSENFLENLKKLGFKTFDQWWPESYDLYERVPRVNEIIAVLEYINKQPFEVLNRWNDEMQEVLEHNRALLISDDWFRKVEELWDSS